MPPVRPARLLLSLLAWTLLALPVGATTVLRQGLDALTDGADVVVRGVVERVEGHAEVEGQPFRLARVRVEESLAGRAPARVEVRLLGGAALDGMPRVALGVPELVVGDEVLLFLTRVAPGITARASRPAGGDFTGRRGRASAATGPPAVEQWMPIALALGTYHVRRESGRVLASRDPAGLGLAVAGDAPADGDAPAIIDLADLSTRVKARRAAQGRP